MSILVWLVSLSACTAALLASIYAVLASRALGRRVERLESTLPTLAGRLSRLEGVIGKALEAIDGVEEARRLKLRRRRRYIAAVIVYEGRLPADPRLVAESIEAAVARLGGEVGLAEARPSVVYYDPVRGALIVRTNHLSVNLVLAALPLVRRIGDARVAILPLRTAGTIRSARRALGVLEKIPSRAG